MKLLDVTLPAGAAFEEPLPAQWNGFIYLMTGELAIGGTTLPAKQLAVLGTGDLLQLQAVAESHLLLVAGAPIGEPVARYGPFVMNTEAELHQAFRDFQRGDF